MISVIIPVYNVKKYLRECIDSVLRQTYQELEIIIVNDGSTDGSEMIVDEYQKSDSRIIAIHQENAGLSAARNTGLQYARGEYIAFVVSDDRIDEKMLESLVNVIRQYETEVAICSHRVIAEQTVRKVYDFHKEENLHCIELLSGRECVERIYSKDLVDMTVVWNKLYKRNLFKQMRFPIGRVHEDEFLIYKILYP